MKVIVLGAGVVGILVHTHKPSFESAVRLMEYQRRLGAATRSSYATS